MENAEGKDVKKQKTDKKNTKAREEEKSAASGYEEQKKEEENKDEEAAPKKKASGRPEGTGSRGAKAKGEPKPRRIEDVGSHTRNRI